MLDWNLLKQAPFDLSDAKVEWVKATLSSMSQEEKIGQIFCPICGEEQEEKIPAYVEEFHPGGLLYRPMPAAKIQSLHRAFQETAKIPLLLAANLESGGVGIASDGTYFSRPMGIAATGNADHAYHLGAISGKEAAAVGCNWSFAPICDLDRNPMNPIMNVRTYGDSKETVITMVKEQLRGLKEYGLAAACKHFPGDGVDFRDQHLLASVNSLSVEEYDLQDAIEKTTPIGCKIVFCKWVDSVGKEYVSVDMVYQTVDQLKNMPILDMDNLPAIVELNFNGLNRNKDGLYEASEFENHLRQAIEEYEILLEQYETENAA